MAVKNQGAPWVRVDDGFEQRWPGSSARATECSLNVIALAEAIQGRAEQACRAHGIPSVPATNVLAILRGADEPLLPSVIAERMLTTRNNLTGILHRLEGRGLLRRLSPGRDGRQRPVAITDVGRASIDSLQAHLHRADRGLFSALTGAQQAQLLDRIASVQEAFEALWPAGPRIAGPGGSSRLRQPPVS